MQLATGQRTALATLNLSDQLDIAFDVSGSASAYAPLCFVLNADSRLVQPDAMVSPAQTHSNDGAVTYQAERFRVELARLAPGVERLAFAVVPENGDLRGVRRGEVSVSGPGGPAAANWSFSGTDFGNERAIIALELYRHQGDWRLMVNGQGFADGLAGLVRHFGGNGVPDLQPAAAPTPAAQPAPSGGLNLSRPRGNGMPASSAPSSTNPPSTSSPASTPSPSRPLSLTKITLDKQGQSARISLQKAGTQRVHVNLNWDAKPSTAPTPSGGFLSKLLGNVSGVGKAADLDLGCMYELASGEKGVIQALGGNFGNAGGPPFIKLDQDDRSGASAGGENLFIERPDLIRKVLIFAFIYEGAGNFSEVGGRLSFNDPQGNEVKMQLSNPAALPFCAVALVQAQGGELVITKEERYFSGHRDCDEAFGFGFSWKAGRK
ncbi:TerD family protein [Deinococcus alpinitundrae]|uniref:TerD family protein n=1 Tax=Deinococcus alpinitundrae TaxID=468913 RepID=UPI00137B4F6B|nr:TerD family protein [Deinococcus alpinitundrae]